MKKIIYLLILNSFCLFHFNTLAASCEDGFLNRIKRSLSGRNAKPLSLETSREALLKELKNGDVLIQSVVRPSTLHIHFYGNGLPPPTKYLLKAPKGLVEYSAFYVSGKDITHPRNKKPSRRKGQFFLSMSITLDGEARYTYDHWIYWPSEVRNAQLSSDTVKEIFNEIYKTIFGQTLEWLITNNVFPKTMDLVEKNYLSQFDVYDLFNFNALFFKTREQQLRSIVTEVIGERSHQTRPTPKEQSSTLIPPAQMIHGIRRIILNSYSIEQLETLPLAEIRKLPVQDIVEIFNTPEKIQTVDMSSLSLKIQVQLLAEHTLWRESITPEQVQQLDTSVDGIQHVIVPTAKHYVWRPEEELARISIDALTDAQIEKIDRDTFLRDGFLAGELFVDGVAPMKIAMFMTDRKKEIQEHGRSEIMKKSLHKKMHDFIVQWLGFETNFESMTAEQKRELFKAEIDMMINAPQEKAGMMFKTNQQFRLLEAIMEENERGNHNWF